MQANIKNIEIIKYNRFTEAINQRRPHSCRVEYHLKQVAFYTNTPYDELLACYTGEKPIDKHLDAKLCDEFNRPLGYFLAAENAPKKAQNKPKRLDLIGQISMF